MDVDLQLLTINGEILVVEDDPQLRELTREILCDVGAESVAFSTADDALDYMRESKIRCALIIADLGLPGRVQGAELARLVRERWPDIPVIITSGWTDAVVGLPANTIFLAKPWRVEALVTAVMHLLQPVVSTSRAKDVL
ncbi:response regulator [Pseudomonas sp. SDO55104_S430]